MHSPTVLFNIYLVTEKNKTNRGDTSFGPLGQITPIRYKVDGLVAVEWLDGFDNKLWRAPKVSPHQLIYWIVLC